LEVSSLGITFAILFEILLLFLGYHYIRRIALEHRRERNQLKAEIDSLIKEKRELQERLESITSEEEKNKRIDTNK